MWGESVFVFHRQWFQLSVWHNATPGLRNYTKRKYIFMLPEIIQGYNIYIWNNKSSFFQYVILCSSVVVGYKCNIFYMKLIQYNGYLVSNVDIDGLVLSTRASVATVLSMNQCIFRSLWVNKIGQKALTKEFVSHLFLKYTCTFPFLAAIPSSTTRLYFHLITQNSLSMFCPNKRKFTVMEEKIRHLPIL